MRIKKYVADSMPAVLKLVKEDLGPKAVVLNTRTLDKTGILGKKGQVEVTAAIDDSPKAAARKQAPAKKAPAAPAKKAPERPRVETAAPDARPTPLRQPASQRSAPAESDTLSRISAQLTDLQTRLGGGALPADLLPEALGELAKRMEEDDLDRGLTQRVVRSLLTDPGEEGYKAAGPLKARAVRLLSRDMPEPKATAVGKVRSVIALVGTSGAGKTTAAAKLAAHFAARDLRVALVSTDTDRVGGLEQIRAYGGILDLPVDLAYTPDEMRDVLQNRRDADLVIVDTAGIGPADGDAKQELRDIVREAAPNEIHLVLSAPTGLRQMRDAVEGFREVGVDRLLFTRLDETARYGPACSVAAESGISVSYVTNSRIVPGGLYAAEPTTLPKALFVRSLNGVAGT